MLQAQGELRGRRTECDALDRVVRAARAGHSGVLVVRGGEGVGKSALLKFVGEHAAGCRVAKATGVESEMELPFAGLHQLCGPFLDRLPRLPKPQRDGLATAFGLRSGSPSDRFVIGLALLSLLAEVADEQPLVCLVDDVQWLDQVSLQTLAFAARRLLAEPIALIIGARGSGEERTLSNLPELTVGGLDDLDAEALLASVVPGRLDAQIRHRILVEAKGNPLALLELSRGVTVAELAGGFSPPDARPLASQLEQSFVERAQALPPASRLLLLTAAAEPVGDVAVLRSACELLNLPPDAATPPERAGLIEIGSRVRFQHPLMRSAAYRAAAVVDRTAVHRALAEVTDPVSDPDRRAWHQALAASEPNESVAAELERSADRAQRRGGIAATAAFLERATALTPDPVRRTARALTAAQAKVDASALAAAQELLSVAEAGPLSPPQQALHARLRAQIVSARGQASEAAPRHLAAAALFEPLDPTMARETYLEALSAEIFAGRLRADSLGQTAALASRAPAAPGPPKPMDLLLDGVSMRFTEGFAESVAPLKRALRAFRHEAARQDDGLVRWLWLACPVAPEPIAPELWDDETWHQLASDAVRLARDAGALGVLPVALTYRAGVHVHAGELAAAAAAVEEADSIATATGNQPPPYASLMLQAWCGRVATAQKAIQGEAREAQIRGDGRALGLARYATAVLNNGLGRYGVALTEARGACEYEDLGFYGWSLVELIEAAARSGQHPAASSSLEILEERTLRAGTDWALGMLARSRALMSPGPAAESLYREAIDRLERTRIAVHLGRAHMLYGEWLRRENRRTDARSQLRTASEMLRQFGAEAFADRAGRELQATGETPRARGADRSAAHSLSAQELQIARLASTGLSNVEIGGQLFLSRHTIEWHLRKVFAKLGISSRKQLQSELVVAGAGTPA